MNGCQKGRNYLSNVGYQSSSTYLALPDILKTSFNFREQEFNVRTAPATTFHEWLLSLTEEWDFEEVDTAHWQIHHRWRVINEMLKDGDLQLSEVDKGYHLELPIEEKSSDLEGKASSEKRSETALEAERGLTSVL